MARSLLVFAVAALAAAGCRGATLTPGGGFAPVAAPRAVTAGPGAPDARPRGPLVERYGSGSPSRSPERGRVVTDAQLDATTRALERRRPETWEAPRRGATAGERADAAARSFDPYNSRVKGVHAGDGLNIDLKRFVDFMARLFR